MAEETITESADDETDSADADSEETDTGDTEAADSTDDSSSDDTSSDESVDESESKTARLTVISAGSLIAVSYTHLPEDPHGGSDRKDHYGNGARAADRQAVNVKRCIFLSLRAM